jgi:hypothetical protein
LLVQDRREAFSNHGQERHTVRQQVIFIRAIKPGPSSAPKPRRVIKTTAVNHLSGLLGLVAAHRGSRH